MTARDRQDPSTASERDQTELERAAQSHGSAHETAEIHKLLVDTVRDYAIFALDATGHILTWNAGAEHLKGYTADEVVGRHFSIFYPRQALDSGLPQHELEVAEAVGRYEDEGWRLRKDGSRFWANVIITALRDKAGTLVGFAKVTRDLTQRKRAEEELRLSEERFRLLVQEVKDYGIFMLDPTGRVAGWNAGAERIKGYKAEEILGHHFSDFYTAEDIAADKPAMELRVATQTGSFEDEGWRVKKDGSLFWANVVITALRNEKGTLIGFAKVTRDLTDRRAAEQRALAEARRAAEAEAANRAKSEFLATLSHELRTPLNAISGYAELITLGIYGPITEAQHDAVKRVRASSQHLLGLITDLLNFSKIEAGRVTYDLSAVKLSDVADSVKPMIDPQAAARNISIEWQEPDATVVAIADQSKVEQALLNLLTNAVKFTEPGGRVRVRHFEHGDGAALEVSDNGIGIPPEKTEAIFEPFVQVGRSMSNPHEGTGLGLAISRDLARAMGGDLVVHSTLDQGSTFTLTLPLSGQDL